MDDGVRPENSYRLMLDENADMFWVTEGDGVEARYDKDPMSAFGRRFMSGIIGRLPVEFQPLLSVQDHSACW